MKLSFSRETLRGAPLKCRLRMVLVPGAHQEVPGRLPGPRLGVGEVRAAARGQRGQRGVERVDGRLQARLGGRQVCCRREGPRSLQGQDVGVVPVQARVPHGQEGVESRGVSCEGRGERRRNVGSRLEARCLQRRQGRLGGV